LNSGIAHKEILAYFLPVKKLCGKKKDVILILRKENKVAEINKINKVIKVINV
jgi:hypothetical protein